MLTGWDGIRTDIFKKGCWREDTFHKEFGY